MRTNVKIENVGDSARTDNTGIATITLRFTSGPTGQFYLQCQSGQAYTSKSMPIQLVNPINKITFIDSAGQDLTYPFERTNLNQILPTYIPIPTPINISIKQDSQQDFTGIIYDLQVKVVDYNIVLAVMNKVQADISNFTLSDIQIINSFGQNQTTVKDELSRLWDIITTGANALTNSIAMTETVQTKNAVLNKISNYYQIRNLEIELSQPGEYQLIISINGIESQRSDVIRIIDDQTANESTLEILSGTILVYLVYGLCIFLSIVNISRSPTILNFLALGGVSFGIAVVSIQKQYQTFFFIFMIITLGFLIINLVEITLIKIFGNEDKFSHESLKKEIFKEYTYQRLYHKPSIKWVIFIKTNNNRECELKGKTSLAVKTDLQYLRIILCKKLQ